MLVVEENKATLDRHFEAFARKVTQFYCLFRLCVSRSKSAVFAFIQYLATFLPNLNPHFNFIKVQLTGR